MFEPNGGAAALAPNVTTTLQDDIARHLPIPAANTTSWQLEATVLALRNAGVAIGALQNQTVVTNAFKGWDSIRIRRKGI